MDRHGQRHGQTWKNMERHGKTWAETCKDRERHGIKSKFYRNLVVNPWTCWRKPLQSLHKAMANLSNPIGPHTMFIRVQWLCLKLP